MNYWVTPKGVVYQGETSGGSWHTRLCNKVLDQDPVLSEKFWNWYDKGNGYTYDYFEKELKWVRYCDWGDIGWVLEPGRKLTKKQREAMFGLTGYHHI